MLSIRTALLFKKKMWKDLGPQVLFFILPLPCKSLYASAFERSMVLCDSQRSLHNQGPGDQGSCAEIPLK